VPFEYAYGALDNTGAGGADGRASEFEVGAIGATDEATGAFPLAVAPTVIVTVLRATVTVRGAAQSLGAATRLETGAGMT